MKENDTNSIDEIQTIDLKEINGIKDLHARLAETLKFPDADVHDWDTFWSTIIETAVLPSALVLYNYRSLAEVSEVDAKTFLQLAWDYNLKGYDSVIMFDHFEKSEVGSSLNAIEHIFAKRPSQFGLRGDPHLWDELERYFKNISMPVDEIGLRNQIHKAIESLTGCTIEKNKNFYIKSYNTGGMSGGMVCSDFWLRKAIPLLISRFRRMKTIW